MIGDGVDVNWHRSPLEFLSSIDVSLNFDTFRFLGDFVLLLCFLPNPTHRLTRQVILLVLLILERVSESSMNYTTHILGILSSYN